MHFRSKAQKTPPHPDKTKTFAHALSIKGIASSTDTVISYHA